MKVELVCRIYDVLYNIGIKKKRKFNVIKMLQFYIHDSDMIIVNRNCRCVLLSIFNCACVCVLI